MIFNCDNVLPHKSNNYLYDVLRARGIDDPDDYLNVSEADLTDGWLLDNMDAAVDAVNNIMMHGGNVVITVDPDVDGFTSAAIMWLYLKKIDMDNHINLNYVLHAGKQHGTDDLIEEIEQYEPDLLIVPDAGSSEIDVHKAYRESHPDAKILVLDHHLTDVEDDPYCIRINNQISPNFSNKTLCGAGVVFKFCQCFDDMYDLDYANEFYDLAAVGLVGDMMDLRNKETHFIVQTGLNNITNSGLIAFVDSLSYSLNGRTKLTPTDVAFYIAPAINAVIRVGTQDTKAAVFEALLDGTRVVKSTKRGAGPNDTEISGEQAARLARNAKAMQDRIIEKALDTLEATIYKMDLLENKVLVVPVSDADDIHPSITGLVAMKLATKYHRPTLVLRQGEGHTLKGSARAEEGISIGGFKEYLDSTGLFEYAQGHSMAFGAGIKESKLDEFLKKTNDELASVDFNEKSYTVDYLFNADEEFTDLIRDLDMGTSLYGQNLKEPTIGVQNIELKRDEVTIMKNNCMKFTHNGIAYVIFKNADAIEDFTANEHMFVSIYGKGNMNEWLGHKTCQIIVNAYEIKKPTYVF